MCSSNNKCECVCVIIKKKNPGLLHFVSAGVFPISLDQDQCFPTLVTRTPGLCGPVGGTKKIILVMTEFAWKIKEAYKRNRLIK